MARRHRRHGGGRGGHNRHRGGGGRNQNPPQGGGGGGAPVPPQQNPGQPGVPLPTIPPFLTAQDMQDRLAAEQDMQSTIRNEDFNLQDLYNQNRYDRFNLARQQKYDLRDASNVDAARGLYQSSVRDADLYDINATAAIRKNFLDRQLDSATLRAQTTKLAASNAWDQYQSTLNQRMVENAQAASEGLPYFAPSPSDMNPNPTAPPNPAGQPQPGGGGYGQGGGGGGGGGGHRGRRHGGRHGRGSHGRH